MPALPTPEGSTGIYHITTRRHKHYNRPFLKVKTFRDIFGLYFIDVKAWQEK